jgi:hypothetical protein
LNTRPKGEIRLLALIPHRDIRKQLRGWSEKLFAAGFAGAWSFPWVAPLAVLSRPFTADELREAALALREAANREPASPGSRAAGAGRSGDGAIGLSGPQTSPFPGKNTELYGLGLDLGFSPPGEKSASKILHPFSPLVLGAALVKPAPRPPSPPAPPPLFSFRAAALANMVFRPLGAGEKDYSFEWKIGRLQWLPPVKKKKT